jgi:hypothetical protein
MTFPKDIIKKLEVALNKQVNFIFMDEERGKPKKK